MLIKIDSHNGVPVYRQIMDQVRFQITAGTLVPGEPLDSVRNLAAALGINSMTVSKAYSLLERERLVERRRGQQLVVASRRRTQHEASREDHLRLALAPGVSVVRQLGISPEDATKVFQEMLAEEIEEPIHEHHR
jgi:GntR family transcriptional regulator